MKFEFETVKSDEIRRALAAQTEFNDRETAALKAYRAAILLKANLVNPDALSSITCADI